MLALLACIVSAILLSIGPKYRQCFLLAFLQGSAETEPPVAPCGSWAEMCLLLPRSLARCTKLSTEVSKESEVFLSKQEKQMAREKGEDVVSPQKGERNGIVFRLVCASATNKIENVFTNHHV